MLDRDLREAEMATCRAECDDVDRQIAALLSTNVANNPDADAKLRALLERHKAAAERWSRTTKVLRNSNRGTA
jgi:hypothetical protein